MKIKRAILSGIIGILAMVSCRQDKTGQKTETEVAPKPKAAATYAEISIKEGGEWQGKKYVGEDFTFKNVQYLKAPDSLTDHSYYIRYEGPGWESSKVGYRLYFDWRNAIDIFGKKVDTMVLSKVGLDNYDSYHEDNPWGQDILKAGKSLGIGSYGRFDGDKTVVHFKEVDSTTAQIHNTDDGSGVTINYYGWDALGQKINLTSELMIAPESRMTKVTLTPSMAGEGLSTGIVRFDDIDVISKESGNGWAYIATYGEQTLVPDDLGMVIFYRTSDAEALIEAEFDHLLVFKPTTSPITYYFAAAWEKEKEGVKTKEEFMNYINTTLEKLD